MIPRLLEKLVLKQLQASNKILTILGARQVGKTTLLKAIQGKLTRGKKEVLYLNCDLEEDKAVIDTASLTVIKALLGNTDYVFIDEVQRLENPGLTLKIIHDNIKKTKVLATGSSSFKLRNQLSDALTGRYIDFSLYPLALVEVLNTLGPSLNQILLQKQATALLENVLLYGLYPEIHLTSKNEDKALYLEKVIESYLFKDILAFQKIRNTQAIRDLTRAIAYQIGAEINESELANRLKIDRKTVANYLDILEQSFVIIRLFPYSKNPRREIGKKYKVYFTDIGIRNSLIGDFNPINVRSDLGSLWENFLIVERIKAYANQGKSLQRNFWRTYGGAEVDYLERPLAQKRIQAFEIKRTRTKLSKGARLFGQEYGISVNLVNQENYLEFIQNT